MIPASAYPQQSCAGELPAGNDWRRAWREAITDPLELLRRLGLDDHASDLLPAADTGFPMRVPESFVARMRPGDPYDPLLRQVLPGAAELTTVTGYGTDAVGDLAARRAVGVIQKYHGRALLIATGACAVNCRYCFRRHFPYAEELAARDRWRAALSVLADDASIAEVILSGGDPLSLSTERLRELTDGLSQIAHIRLLRIHTRLPIVLPERVDPALCAWLGNLPWPVAIVVHANHGNEIDGATATALARLRATGATMLNQSVLLRDINDDVGVLAELSRRLYRAGTLPYYLHLLDRVQGAAHFDVEQTRAKVLHANLRACLPGYLVPRLVREIPGEPAKTPV